MADVNCSDQYRVFTFAFDAAALLTLRHAGKGYDSFEPLPIGQWAGWTYEERDRDGIRRARWMPRALHAEGQKSGFGPSAGVRVPDDGRIAPASPLARCGHRLLRGKSGNRRQVRRHRGHPPEKL